MLEEKKRESTAMSAVCSYASLCFRVDVRTIYHHLALPYRERNSAGVCVAYRPFSRL